MSILTCSASTQTDDGHEDTKKDPKEGEKCINIKTSISEANTPTQNNNDYGRNVYIGIAPNPKGGDICIRLHIYVWRAPNPKGGDNRIRRT